MTEYKERVLNYWKFRLRFEDREPKDHYWLYQLYLSEIKEDIELCDTIVKLHGFAEASKFFKVAYETFQSVNQISFGFDLLNRRLQLTKSTGNSGNILKFFTDGQRNDLEYVNKFSETEVQTLSSKSLLEISEKIYLTFLREWAKWSEEFHKNVVGWF